MSRSVNPRVLPGHNQNCCLGNGSYRVSVNTAEMVPAIVLPLGVLVGILEPVLFRTNFRISIICLCAAPLENPMGLFPQVVLKSKRKHMYLP